MHAVDLFNLRAYVEAKGAKALNDHEYMLYCPECGKRKLAVNVERKNWHCWVCESYELGVDGRRRAVRGAGGLFDLLQLLDGMSRHQAIEYVINATQAEKRRVFERLEHERTTPAVVKQQHIPHTRTIPYPEYATPFHGPHPYLAQRGITPQDVQTFGLFFCSAGQYANRIIFPVWEAGGLAYYQARAAYDPAIVRVLNPPAELGVTSAQVLMNLNQAARHNRVAITEGPVDCIHAGVDAVASFGKKLSMTQIAKLYRSGVRAVDLMWDGPSEREPNGALPEMEAAARTLSELFDVRLVKLPWGDPGDYPRHELQQLRRSGEPAVKHSRLFAPMMGF